jgi:IclR family transcriptional regulator, pca regulon regulatory protein
MKLTDPSPAPPPPRDFVAPVKHVINVLRAFDTQHVEMTLSEVSRRTGLDRSGARRYLLSLAYLGYVVRRANLFRLSPKVLQLGEAFLSGMPIAEIAQTYLDAITRETQQTCAIGILDGEDVIYIARTIPKRVMAPSVPVGNRNPALSVSTGRVLLAFAKPADKEQYIRDMSFEHFTWRQAANVVQLNAELLKIRKAGYAIADQEFEVGVRAIAVPILRIDGTPVAGLCVVTNASTVAKKQLTDEFLPLMREAVSELQVALAR